MNSILYVRIISPTQLIFQGQAQSVSSKNVDGVFDILPQHANFITLIEGNPIIVRTPDKKSLSFNLPLAIIFTRENKVNIYTYIQPQVNKKT